MVKVIKESVVEFKKSNDEQQIVYGEVYKPDCRDSDGNWMSRSTIEKMAYDFMRDLKNNQVDKNHDGQAGKGAVVESFIVRKGDPDFTEGSWVVGVHVPDKAMWEQIKKGELTGFSIAGEGQLIEEEAKQVE